MKSSEYGRLTDELLSAYIDNAVTEQERSLVEAAVAVDAEIAWRLDTLQQTVQMLRALPELALPRSFALQESQIQDTVSARAGQAGRVSQPSVFGRIAGGWRAFWQPGSPVFRNLATASLVLLLVLAGGGVLIGTFMGGMYGPPAAEIAFSEPAVSGANAELAATAELLTEPQAAEAGAPAPAQDAVGAVEAPEMRAQEAPAEETIPAAAVAAGESPPEAEAAAALDAAEAEESVMAESAPAPAPQAAEVLALEAPAAPAAAAAEPPPPDETVTAKVAPAEQAAEPEMAGAAAEPPSADAAVTEATAAEEALPGEAELSVSEEPSQPVAQPSASDGERGEKAVAALPVATATATALPTPTAQALTAAESPQRTPYPAPEQETGTGWGAFTPLQFLALGLLAATVIFGGLWWRSRSAPEHELDPGAE